MNQRDAKRIAYLHASLIIESTLAAGWTYDKEGVTEEDAAKVEKALAEIVQSLLRKA